MKKKLYFVLKKGIAMRNLIVATMAATQQLFSSFLIIFDDVPTKYKKKASKKRLRELTPYKRNILKPKK